MTQVLVILILIAGAAGLLYLLARPEWMFVVILTMFPLEQVLQSYIPRLAAQSELFNFAIGIGAVLAIVLRSMKGENIWSGYINPLMLTVLAFYALWGIGWLYSPTPYEFDLRGHSYLGLFLFLLPAQIVGVIELRKLITGLMVFGAIICFLILINPAGTYYTGRLILDISTGTSGFSGNALATGELGGMVAIIAALIRPSGIGPMFNMMRLVCFIAGMGCAIASGSRGQVLATIACGVLFFPVARKLANPRQFLATAFGFALLLAGIYFSFNFFIGYENVQRWDIGGMADSVTGRFDMVLELLEAYLESPGSWLFGLGTSAYLSVAAALRANYVHNIVIEALCEHGLVGFTLFCSVMVLGFKYGRRLLQTYADDPMLRSVVAVLLALTAYTFILNLKQGAFGGGYEFSWFLLIGKIWWHERRLGAPAAVGQLPDVDLAAIDGDETQPPETAQGASGYALGY